MTRVEMAVFTKGPGDGMMHREKIPSIMRMRYCPSKNDHRCRRRDSMVSAGE